MAKDRQKFIARQDIRRRQILMAIIQNILDGNLSDYDCLPMKWKDNYRRIKYDTIRIIFSKREEQYLIHKIWFRWDVYK